MVSAKSELFQQLAVEDAGDTINRITAVEQSARDQVWEDAKEKVAALVLEDDPEFCQGNPLLLQAAQGDDAAVRQLTDDRELLEMAAAMAVVALNEARSRLFSEFRQLQELE